MIDRLRWRPRSWQVLAGAITVPIVLAVVRGIRRGYLPIGDNALIEIRARDVLTRHHPWLGTWSSASISSEIDVNHPGPLLFDVLALPVRLFGAGPGIAIGVAMLQIAVVWAIGWATYRFGGRAVAAAVLVVTAWFAWSLGSELLYDPWQPNVLMLPCLLLLVLVWGTMAGRAEMLPWAVLVASFCVQTHLSYVFLAPAMVVAAAAAVVHRQRAEARRPLLLATVVGVAAWTQPLVEQLFGPGQGNLSRLLASGGGDEGTRTGITLGLRMVAGVVALPPWWTRSGVMDTLPVTQWSEGPAGPTIEVPGLAGLGLAIVALVAVAVVLGALARSAWRRRDPIVQAGVLTVGVALAIATVTVVITPIDVLGLSPHKVRWLWPIGAMLTMVLVVGIGRTELVRAEVHDRRRVPPGSVVPALGVATMIGALATVPFHAHDAGPVGFRSDMARIRGLVDQLDVLRGRGTVLFDATGLYFAEPYTAPAKAGLQRAGVPFVVDDEGLVRQLGERRRDRGDADLRVFVRDADAALVIPPGVERVAFQPGLDPAGRAELDAFEARLAAWLQTEPGALDLLPAGTTLTDLGRLAFDGVFDPVPALGPDADRFVELDRRWRGLGLAVFAEPLR